MLVRVGRKGKRSSTAITWPADILLLAAPEVNMLSATRTMAGSHMISSMATPYMLRVVSGSSRRASTSLDRTSADRIVILSMAMHGEVIVMLIDFFSFNQYCSCTVSRMFKVTGKGEHSAGRERWGGRNYQEKGWKGTRESFFRLAWPRVVGKEKNGKFRLYTLNRKMPKI